LMSFAVIPDWLFCTHLLPYLYENAPSSLSTGEGYREGGIFILRCARPGHGSYHVDVLFLGRNASKLSWLYLCGNRENKK